MSLPPSRRFALALVALLAFAPAIAAQSVFTVGGAGSDVGRRVAVGPAGDLVVVGGFEGTVDFDPDAGVANRTATNPFTIYALRRDVFVARYTSDGAFVSVATFGAVTASGSAGSVLATGVAVDTDGTAVVTGSFEGTVDFDPGAGVESRTSEDQASVFVARYDARGALVSVATISGTNLVHARSVAVDGSGNAVLTGIFRETVDFDPGPDVVSRTTGTFAMFVVRIDVRGALVVVTTVNATEFADGADVAVDASGNAVVLGSFEGTIDFDPGSSVESRTSFPTRIFVARYDADGAFVSVVDFGSSNNSITGTGVAVDASGTAIVTGSFGGTVDFDPGPGVVSRTSSTVGGGLVDGFVARYTAGGAFVSVLTFVSGGAGQGRVQANDVAADAAGNAVVMGSFGGTIDFDPGAGVVSRTNRGNDVFVARYDARGTLVSVADFGAPNDVFGLGVAVDGSGNAVAVGSFQGTVDFDPGPGVVSRTGGIPGDAFVVRYTPSGSLATNGATLSSIVLNATASGSTARLTWATPSEISTLGFVVDRKTGSGWSAASGLIAGHGTTSERHDYAYTAEILPTGRHPFRLREVRTDGTVYYSAEVIVEIGVVGATEADGARAPRVTMLGGRGVRIETGAAESVTVTVYDVLGRTVEARRVEVSGTVDVPLGAGLAPGQYVVLVAGERVAETRMLVVR